MRSTCSECSRRRAPNKVSTRPRSRKSSRLCRWAWIGKPWRVRPRLDVDPSGTRTIVEVQTEADSGVLRRITLAFAAEGIEIEVARCNTEADRVFNVFYVPLLDDAGRGSLEDRLSRYLD